MSREEQALTDLCGMLDHIGTAVEQVGDRMAGLAFIARFFFCEREGEDGVDLLDEAFTLMRTVLGADDGRDAFLRSVVDPSKISEDSRANASDRHH